MKYIYVPNIPISAVGATDREVRIVEWVKYEGETFIKFEPILYVEARVGIVEVQAPQTGTLHQILAPRGSIVKIGQPVATFVEGVHGY